MRYNNHLNYRRREQFLFRVRLFAVGTLFLCGIVVAYFYYDNRKGRTINTENTTTSAPNSAYFAPSVKVFRSPYFQFQANNSWVEVPGESSPNKYIYRSLRSTLIENDLTIYVNQVPNNLAPTRVLPVSIKLGNELSPTAVSEHCKQGLTTAELNRNTVPLTKNKVSFVCNSQSSAYNVLVGLIDGDANINLKRPDGSNAVYTIYYRDLRAVPDPSQIMQITSTFQAR